jgi:hypothetical protein
VPLTPRQQDIAAFVGLAIAAAIFMTLIVAGPAHGLTGPIKTNPVDTPEEWSILVGRWFGEGEHDQAMSILSCESGFDPTADNPTSTAQGGWQFLKSTWGWATIESGYELDPYPDGPNDPEQSTRLAAWLQDEYGWLQWQCAGMVAVADWPQTVDLLAEEQQAR